MLAGRSGCFFNKKMAPDAVFFARTGTTGGPDFTAPVLKVLRCLDRCAVCGVSAGEKPCLTELKAVQLCGHTVSRSVHDGMTIGKGVQR